MAQPVTKPRICETKFCSGSPNWYYEPPWQVVL